MKRTKFFLGVVFSLSLVVNSVYGGNMKKLFEQAASHKNNKVTYIISGDSTRNNSFNFMISYYKEQFGKINVRVVNNASSGLDAKDWNSNKRKNSCLAKAIAETEGQGENTIMEYSLGINDQGRKASRAEQKKRYKSGIQAYLKAKPKATVILCVPNAHGSAKANQQLYDIYQELGKELHLKVIDTLAITKPVYGDSKYYADGTHPGKWGSRRIVNYIMDQILPASLYDKVTLKEPSKHQATNDKELSCGVESGYYSDSKSRMGAPSRNNKSWRLKEIKIEPNFVLSIKSNGSRNEIFFMNDEGKCVLHRYLGRAPNKRAVDVIIPPEGTRLRMTLALVDPKYKYDPSKVSIKYNVNKVNYMSVDDINKGLNIRLKKVK